MTQWLPFDSDHKPQIDRPFHIENSPAPNTALNTYRIHVVPHSLPNLQLRQDDGSWRDVNCANAAWLIKIGKWHYANEPEQKENV